MKRDPGALARCLLALIDSDETTDEVERQAGAYVLAESLIAWRQQQGVR